MSLFSRTIVSSLRPARRNTFHSSYFLSRLQFNCYGLRFIHSSRIKRAEAAEPAGTEALNVSHSRFLAEATGAAPWKAKDDHLTPADEDYEGIGPGRGRLNPTSSHIFKLILPLDSVIPDDVQRPNDDPSPLVLLLHPSQPLSHISRLILSEIMASLDEGIPPQITFRSSTGSGDVRWSESTDVGDFIRASARTAHFDICFRYRRGSSPEDVIEKTIDVDVGSFADRTRFLRRRLALVEAQLKRLSGVKKQCDQEAHAGARRLAIGGFGMLVVYWGLVCKLTFFTSLGWDVMEPVTYLSGLSMVILGYLWFLYQGREVSYSSVLNRSINARREALYQARGFDIDRWDDLVLEAKKIKRDITKIAEDYDYPDEDEDNRRKKDRDESDRDEESDLDKDLKSNKKDKS